jgi:hypothetical protein
LIEEGISENPAQRDEQAAPVIIDIVGQAFGGNDVTLFARTYKEEDGPGQPGGEEVGTNVKTTVLPPSGGGVGAECPRRSPVCFALTAQKWISLMLSR